MALFESYERRIDQINAELAKHGISSIEEAKEICDKAGVDAYNMLIFCQQLFGCLGCNQMRLLPPKVLGVLPP